MRARIAGGSAQELSIRRGFDLKRLELKPSEHAARPKSNNRATFPNHSLHDAISRGGILPDICAHEQAIDMDHNSYGARIAMTWRIAPPLARTLANRKILRLSSNTSGARSVGRAACSEMPHNRHEADIPTSALGPGRRPEIDGSVRAVALRKEAVRNEELGVRVIAIADRHLRSRSHGHGSSTAWKARR